MVAIDKLRTLHTLLWHARDEAGNKRLKQQLSQAIEIVEDLIRGTEDAQNLVKVLTDRKVSLGGEDRKN